VNASVQSFTTKQTRTTFTLSNGTFSSGSNQVQLAGLRTVANVRSAGFPAFPEADVQIYGMAQSDMNALIALNFKTDGVNRNTMLLEVNNGAGWTAIFSGQILSAQPDYSAMPNVCLQVNGRVLGFESINPAPPTSYQGATDVAEIVSTLAAAMGYAFQNNGVTAQLSNPYFPNTLAEQLRSVCLQAGIDCYIDGNAIVITPKGQPRQTQVWTLSPQTGLVGYPTRDSRGYILARCLFNPALRFGGLVNLQNSGLPNVPGNPAYNTDGSWLVSTVSHQIEAVKPDGIWFTDILCYPPGSLPPLS
jgi:hypothetical protein